MVVVSADEAARRGLVAHPLSRDFGPDEDGTKLVDDLLAEAKRQGATAVSDISVSLASRAAEGPVACRTEILPETVAETRTIPGGSQLVSVQRPVQRMVTESEYRCHTTSHPGDARSTTEYHQSCHTVSRPVSRTRTTYSYQYDSFTHSSRSVPHTQSYTEYQSHQECRSEPQLKTRTESVSRNECRMEPVTHMVTRYEFQLESRYVPPRLETFTRFRLHETEPQCALVAPAAAPPAGAADTPPLPANHIDAVLYFAP